MKNKGVYGRRPSRMEEERTFEAWLEEKDGSGPYTVEKIWLTTEGTRSLRQSLGGIIFLGEIGELRSKGLPSFLTTVTTNLAALVPQQKGYAPTLRDYSAFRNIHRYTEWLFLLEEEKESHLPTMEEIIAKLHTIANAFGYSKIDRMRIRHAFKVWSPTPKKGYKWISEGDYLLQQYRETNNTVKQGVE